MTSPQTTESTTALPHERVEPKDTASAPFVARHIGPRPADVEHMLQTLGYDSLEALVDTAVPAGIRQPKPLELPAPLTESAVLEQLREIAEKKMKDLNANDVEAAMKIVAGTARSMGVEVEA